MSHIEQCRNVWYATLKVPEALRGTLGRTKFKQTLGTTDKRRAQLLAPALIAQWKATIRQAAGDPDAVRTEALRWREAIEEERQSGDGERLYQARSLLAEKAQALENIKGEEVAGRFADIALGIKTPSDLHREAWEASIGHLAAKTQDQMKKDVGLLIEKFSALEDITPQAMRRWTEDMANKGTSPASMKRMVSFWRSYWRHLVSVDAVRPESQPFASVTIRKAAKADKGWSPFAPADVVGLWQAAVAKGDQVLGDLVLLGAFTGARIEELCSLEAAHVTDKSFRIVDSKTEAGVREVPIHSALVPLVKRLREETADKYLLSGLTFNKYQDRSNAIGKRFGRLKTAAGFDDRYVFHSIRKTLVTLLENAGVSENLAADIVGHEKPRITYGLYSGGASLAVKAEALERVRYPAA